MTPSRICGRGWRWLEDLEWRWGYNFFVFFLFDLSWTCTIEDVDFYLTF